MCQVCNGCNEGKCFLGRMFLVLCSHSCGIQPCCVVLPCRLGGRWCLTRRWRPAAVPCWTVEPCWQRRTQGEAWLLWAACSTTQAFATPTSTSLGTTGQLAACDFECTLYCCKLHHCSSTRKTVFLTDQALTDCLRCTPAALASQGAGAVPAAGASPDQPPGRVPV